jgi:hypothetical protein
MKARAAWLAALAWGAAAGAAAAPDPLEPGRPAEIYVAPGHATTVQLRSSERIAAISLASPIVSYKYDKALNQIEITPAARAGGAETNLNLRIGEDVYILLLKVVTDVRAQYLRTFVLAGEAGAEDEAAIGRAPPLAPAEVDLVGAARALERAEADPVFRAAQASLRIERLGRTYPWNGCQIALEELAQFVDRDLLVFRVRWTNATADALYLDESQFGLWAGARPIPVIARYQEGAGPVVLPGQEQRVYLAVQGYRLSRHNDWRLALPPSAEALGRLADPR